MSMLCRLRKVLLSNGVSMLEGWGIGSQSMTTQVSGDSLYPHRARVWQLLYTLRWPVQCSTWGREALIQKLRSLLQWLKPLTFCSLLCDKVTAHQIQSLYYKYNVQKQLCSFHHPNTTEQMIPVDSIMILNHNILNNSHYLSVTIKHHQTI